MGAVSFVRRVVHNLVTCRSTSVDFVLIAHMVNHMVRRGQQHKKDLRRARAQVAEELASPQGEYRPPDRAGCRERVWQTMGDDGNTVRLENRTWRKGGKLVDFVINAQVLTADGWRTIEYIDCCHGHCHHHPQNNTEPRPIQRLDGVEDVEKAFREAQPLIYERLRIIRG